MSDFSFTNDQVPEDDEDARPVGIPKKDLKALRERSRRAEEAEARAAEAERKLAFAQAGIDLTDELRAEYFINGYKGEPSREAIQAEWVRLYGDRSDTGGGLSAEDLAHQRVAAAAAGSEPPKPTLYSTEDLSNADSSEAVLRMAGEMGLLPQTQ